jgi:hypothetical protein
VERRELVKSLGIHELGVEFERIRIMGGTTGNYTKAKETPLRFFIRCIYGEHKHTEAISHEHTQQRRFI